VTEHADHGPYWNMKPEGAGMTGVGTVAPHVDGKTLFCVCAGLAAATQNWSEAVTVGTDPSYARQTIERDAEQEHAHCCASHWYTVHVATEHTWLVVGFVIVKHCESGNDRPLLPVHITVLVWMLDPGVPQVSEQPPHGEEM
jgi:hypothetical protein